MADNGDLIFIMEGYMGLDVIARFRRPPAEIVTLDIADDYERSGASLLRLLRDALALYPT